MKNHYFIYFIAITAFLFLVLQFKGFILKALYDVQYLEASHLFQFQIFGDFFAFLALPFSIYLIAAVKTKTYIITELLSALIFVTLIVLKTDIGIEILVFAHIIRFICYFLILSLIGIKSLRNVR